MSNISSVLDWMEKHLLDTGFKRMAVLGVGLLCVGMLYSGGNFLRLMDQAIPAGVTGGNVHFMTPGDHHEQFYRFSLFKTNLLRGNMPYFSGYQFASGLPHGEFTEGMVFFPFSAINGLLAFLTGDILAFNLISLLSYVYVGLAMYALVSRLTASRMAGAVAAFYLSTVPFRTSFLYGQMAFATDAVMLPLLILTIEQACSTGRRAVFALAGALLFMFCTSNFQVFYWVVLIISPYFIYKIIMFFKSWSGSMWSGLSRIAWVLPGMILVAAYLLFLYGIMKGSVLHSGQNFSETLRFTPTWKNLFTVFSGNEKNMYLGVTALFVLPVAGWLAVKGRGGAGADPLLRIFWISFLAAGYFSFGPRIDGLTGIPLYQWLFQHVPGFSGTRTPGRIMAVAMVVYAILLGYAFPVLKSRVEALGGKAWGAALGLAVIFCVVWDFKFTNPSMCILAGPNSAYARIADRQTKVVTVPFQNISAHFLNSTFLFFGLKYDLRMMFGHSSLYPKLLDQQTEFFASLNSGYLSTEQWNWLRRNGYSHIVVHRTAYEPNVGRGALAGFMVSPFLRLIGQDAGVYVFALNSEPDTSKQVSFQAFSNAYRALPAGPTDASACEMLSGWYAREAYPGQKPFRWMRKTHSSLLLDTSSGGAHLSFDYKCPATSLGIASSSPGRVRETPAPNGWRHVVIELEKTPGNPTLVELQASREFRAPPDERVFGCQVSDTEVVRTGAQ